MSRLVNPLQIGLTDPMTFVAALEANKRRQREEAATSGGQPRKPKPQQQAPAEPTAGAQPPAAPAPTAATPAAPTPTSTAFDDFKAQREAALLAHNEELKALAAQGVPSGDLSRKRSYERYQNRLGQLRALENRAMREAQRPAKRAARIAADAERKRLLGERLAARDAARSAERSAAGDRSYTSVEDIRTRRPQSTQTDQPVNPSEQALREMSQVPYRTPIADGSSWLDDAIRKQADLLRAQMKRTPTGQLSGLTELYANPEDVGPPVPYTELYAEPGKVGPPAPPRVPIPADIQSTIEKAMYERGADGMAGSMRRGLGEAANYFVNKMLPGMGYAPGHYLGIPAEREKQAQEAVKNLATLVRERAGLPNTMEAATQEGYYPMMQESFDELKKTLGLDEATASRLQDLLLERGTLRNPAPAPAPAPAPVGPAGSGPAPASAPAAAPAPTMPPEELIASLPPDQQKMVRDQLAQREMLAEMERMSTSGYGAIANRGLGENLLRSADDTIRQIESLFGGGPGPQGGGQRRIERGPSQGAPAVPARPVPSRPAPPMSVPTQTTGPVAATAPRQANPLDNRFNPVKDLLDQYYGQMTEDMISGQAKQLRPGYTEAVGSQGNPPAPTPAPPPAPAPQPTFNELYQNLTPEQKALIDAQMKQRNIRNIGGVPNPIVGRTRNPSFEAGPGVPRNPDGSISWDAVAELLR